MSLFKLDKDTNDGLANVQTVLINNLGKVTDALGKVTNAVINDCRVNATAGGDHFPSLSCPSQ